LKRGSQVSLVITRTRLLADWAVKVKVKFALNQATKVQRWNRNIAVLFL